MPTVTFQILEGIDKGRTFREMPTPVSIGREEGNVVRLNDERVSRFHAKIQSDNEEIILTDLESTNGTRVNGTVVQIRRLRPGDRLGIGRSVLLFGSEEEINSRQANLNGTALPPVQEGAADSVAATVQANVLAAQFDHDLHFDLSVTEKITISMGNLFQGARPLPPLPERMSPAQAARLAELLDFLHRHLSVATDNIRANEDGTQVNLGYSDWQRIQAIHMLLARYVRAVTEPDVLNE